MISLRTLLLRRLTWPLLSLVLVDVAISYVVALHFSNLAYDRWLLDSARSLAQEVKSHQDGIWFELPPIAVEVFRWDEVDKTFFKIESLATGFLAGDRGLPSPDAADLEWDQPLYRDKLMVGEAVRVVSILHSPAASDERVVVSVAETLHKRQAIVRDIILAVALPQLVLVVMALVHVRTGIKRGLQPLVQLNHMIDARTARDLSPIPDSDVPLEVRSLTHTINALLGRLGVAISSQQRFIENAAHQLRTPLAGLKLQAERAARAQTIEELKPALSHIMGSVDRAAHLASQLLALARSEYSLLGQTEMQTINLVDLTREICLDWAPRALERHMDLAFAAPAAVTNVAGNATLLRELLNNLLDNAVRYGRPGGNLQVGIEPLTDSRQVRLVVTDDGPGIMPAEQGKVLERFYRVPGTPGEGCGLGLAIVREIADLHQAQLVISTNPGGGCRIAVVIPLLPMAMADA